METGEATGRTELQKTISLFYHVRILTIVLSLIVVVYGLRTGLAILENSPQETAIHGVLAFTLLTFIILANNSNAYRLLSLLATFAVVAAEATLTYAGFVNISQFYFVIPLAIVFVWMMAGASYGILISGTATLLGVILALTRPPEVVFAVAPEQVDDARLAFFAYMMVTNALIFAIILFFQELVGKSQVEIQKRVADSEKTSRRLALADTMGKAAHEINNPLAILDGAFRLLKRHAQHDSREFRIRALQHMGSAHTRLRSVLQNIKAFTGTDLVEERSAVPVTEVLRRFEVNSKEKIGSFGFTLVVEDATEDASVLCRADDVLLVLTLFLDNALEATPHSEKTIRIKTQTGERIRFALEDFGRGVDPDSADRVFEPFFTTKPIGRSMGMNLSICKTLIEDQEGIIGYLSKHHGAVFWFELERA